MPPPVRAGVAIAGFIAAATGGGRVGCVAFAVGLAVAIKDVRHKVGVEACVLLAADGIAVLVRHHLQQACELRCSTAPSAFTAHPRSVDALIRREMGMAKAPQ